MALHADRPIGQALGDIVSTLGLMAAIFYLLTAGTAGWYYRRARTASASSLLLGGALPHGDLVAADLAGPDAA